MDWFSICGAGFIIIFGTLAHFLYDWTGHNRFIGFFTAVNESTWEHLKLIIAPSLLWLVADWHFYAGDPRVLLARLLGILAAMLLIPLWFYGYQALLRRDVLWLDILSFVVAAVAEQWVFYQVLRWPALVMNPVVAGVVLHLGAVGLLILFIIYLTHTYAPDHNFLYRDPITHRYGLRAHPPHRQQPQAPPKTQQKQSRQKRKAQPKQ